MKRTVFLRLGALLAAACVLSGCGADRPETPAERLSRTYYAGQDDRACRMLQKSIFEGLLDDWTPAEVQNPVWNFDTFTRYEVLDRELEIVEQEEALYCCTFSADGEKSGFVVVSYDGDSLSRVRVEETPYRYDLRAHLDAVLAELEKTDLDLPSAEAVRVRAGAGDDAAEAIRIEDGAGRRALCRFDESAVTVTVSAPPT